MDNRKVIKAHWPPRRINVVKIELDEETYAVLYLAACAANRSLSDEIRTRLK